MLQLKVEQGQDQGKELVLRDGKYVVGRSSTCGWRLASDDRVSRQHCEIRVNNGRAILSNLSAQGTILVGSGPIEGQLMLKDGLTIRLGSSDTQIGVHEVTEEPPATTEFSLGTSILPTDIFRPPEREPFDDGPLTRDAPEITEAFCKQELGADFRTKALLVFGLALALMAGTILIWVLL